MEVPSINWMRTISVYETLTHLYMVGSDTDETRFRVLKIDRFPVPIDEDSCFLECTGDSTCAATVEAESPFDRLWRLNITDDPFVYSKSDMARLLHTIQAANRKNFQAASRSSSSSDLKSLNSNSSVSSQMSSWLRLGNVFRRRRPQLSSSNRSQLNEPPVDPITEGTPTSPREMQQAAASALLSGTGEPSLVLSTKCDGLVGVVRFLRGYYLILITKSRLIAQIGEHKIYKIEDTTTIYIPGNDGAELVVNGASTRSRATSVSKSKEEDMVGVLAPPVSFDANPEWTQFCATTASRARILSEEARYLKLFNSVDLGSNFYYSHTYDLSHTLQHNMQMQSNRHDVDPNLSTTGIPKPNDRFVWNWRLIPPRFRPGVYQNSSSNANDSSGFQPQWFIPLFHGTISQAAISACGMPMYITLIGRRSRHFAGTRFLKRGTSLLGNVANEVETEQIVHDSSYSCLHRTRCSSYVQLRGSVPLFWSQESSKLVVGRPPLELSREDPYYEAFGAHFRNLFERYGSPVIVFNLMKRREKRRFELALSEGYERGLAYLSQFLPSRIPRPDLGTSRMEDQFFDGDNPPLIYIGFDIARVQKHKRLVAIDQLHPIVDGCIRRTGIFLSCPGRKNQTGGVSTRSQHQCGLIRVNCVDCLDRTNTAQFVVGLAALAYQLYHLGFLTEPVISVDSRIERLLQNLYDEHGDTLALQYGGSQLVHNIDTYRKTHKLSSQSRDFLQTLSRYYSNKFSDWDKQCATNLFLRIYRPVCWSGTVFQLVCELLQSIQRKSASASSLANNQENTCGCSPDAVVAQTAAALVGPIWDLTSDNYLHWLDAWTRLPIQRTPLTDWCPRALIQRLPCATGGPMCQTMLSFACQANQLDSNEPHMNYWYAEHQQSQFYQTLDKPSSMSHLRWVELLVQPPPFDSPSLVPRAQYGSFGLVDEYAALVRLKNHSVVSVTAPYNVNNNGQGVDTSANEVPSSPKSFTIDSPTQRLRRRTLASTSSVPNLGQIRTTERSHTRSTKLRKAFNLSPLTPTLEESGDKSETSSVDKIPKSADRQKGSNAGDNEKSNDLLEESSSDSDSVGSTDSFLKFYPPTLAIHAAKSVEPEFAFTTGRIRDMELAKSRLTGKRLPNGQFATFPPFSRSNQAWSVWTAQWSSPPSVFDPSAVPIPVSSEVHAAYERYVAVNDFTCATEAYLTSGCLRTPSAEDMAKYQEHVQFAGGHACPVQSSSMSTYIATAHVSNVLRC